LRGKGPLQLVYQQPMPDRSEASKAAKLALIAGQNVNEI
jgi:hypothetical protein